MHTPHPHEPQNVNNLHKAEIDANGFNERLALKLKNSIGTMRCIYLFSFIGVCAVVGSITGSIVLALTFGSISSGFLQLVLLPVIVKAQNMQDQKSSKQADQIYQFALMTKYNTEVIIQQNNQLIKALEAKQ